MVIRGFLTLLALFGAAAAAQAGPVTPILAPAPESAEVARPGAYFSDSEAACPVMVVAPAGSQLLGSTAGDTTREGVEGQKWINRDKPQYTVTIAKPFAVGAFEVTVGQYRQFATETHRADGPDCWIYNPDAAVKYTFEVVPGVTWRDYSMLDHRSQDNEPIARIAWQHEGLCRLAVGQDRQTLSSAQRKRVGICGPRGELDLTLLGATTATMPASSPTSAT